MGYDRPLVNESCLLDEGSVLLRRSHGQLVAFTPTLMLAMPFNHNMCLTTDVSRHARDLLLYKDKCAAGGTQAEPPRLGSAEVRGFLASEYSTKYSTKADNTTMNENTLLAAIAVKNNSARTDQQQASGFLAKMLNGMNGSYSVPTMMAASYLLGHGDSMTSFDCVPYNARAYALDLAARSRVVVDDCGHGDAGEDHEVELEAAVGGAADAPAATTAAGSMRLVAAKEAYLQRDEAFDSFSPFEMAMAFNVVKPRSPAAKTDATASSSAAEAAAAEEGVAAGYRHQPRKTMIIPQFISEAPTRPLDTASAELRVFYAAFALGNFYPYDRHLHELDGETLWDQFLDWEKNKPRKELDAFAFGMLDNIQLRCMARVEMKVEWSNAVVRRHNVRSVDSEGPGCMGQVDDGGHGGADVEGFDGAAEDPDTLLHLASLAAGMDDPGQRGSSYEKDALRVIRSSSVSPATQAVSARGVVQADDDRSEALASAFQELKASKKLHGGCAEPSKASGSGGKVLHVRYTGTGSVQAKVQFIGAGLQSDADAAAVSAMNAALERGDAPPYVRMPAGADGRPQLPTEDQTIKLFRLCEDQAHAFRIMTHTLHVEIAIAAGGGAAVAADAAHGYHGQLEGPVLPTSFSIASVCAESFHTRLILLGGAGEIDAIAIASVQLPFREMAIAVPLSKK